MTCLKGAGLIAAAALIYAGTAHAGAIKIVNHTTQTVKVSAIGGAAKVAPNEEKTIDFKNEENGGDINIWWEKNARQLCQIYTPWDRTILVSGKYEIQCLSKK